VADLTEGMSIRFPGQLAAAAAGLAHRDGMSLGAWIRRETEREIARRSGRCPACGQDLPEHSHG
jgi:hypothetical protein